MRKFAKFLAAAMLLQAGALYAVDVAEKPLVAKTFDAFKQDSARIHQQLQAGGQYEYTSDADKARVEARLKEMSQLLEAHSTQSEMVETDKVALANAQEEINGILHNNDNNRLVCEHVAPVGSHRPVTTCQTYGQMMARERNDQKYLQDRMRTPQNRAGN
jgi:hypothetical protein